MYLKRCVWILDFAGDWIPGGPLSTFYPIMLRLVPRLMEGLRLKCGAQGIGNAIAEQILSYGKAVCGANSSVFSANDELSQMVNVRGVFVREEKRKQRVLKKKGARRLLRSKDSISEFHVHQDNLMQKCREMGIVVCINTMI
jgi:hypothetical protein